MWQHHSFFPSTACFRHTKSDKSLGGCGLTGPDTNKNVWKVTKHRQKPQPWHELSCFLRTHSWLGWKKKRKKKVGVGRASSAVREGKKGSCSCLGSKLGVTTLDKRRYDRYEVLICAAMTGLHCAARQQWKFPSHHNMCFLIHIIQPARSSSNTLVCQVADTTHHPARNKRGCL